MLTFPTNITSSHRILPPITTLPFHFPRRIMKFCGRRRKISIQSFPPTTNYIRLAQRRKWWKILVPFKTRTTPILSLPSSPSSCFSLFFRFSFETHLDSRIPSKGFDAESGIDEDFHYLPSLFTLCNFSSQPHLPNGSQLCP